MSRIWLRKDNRLFLYLDIVLNNHRFDNSLYPHTYLQYLHSVLDAAMSISPPNKFLSIFWLLKCWTNRSENLVDCYYSVICFLFWVSSPFDIENFALVRYPWLNFEILWKTIFYYLVNESFHEVPLISSMCLWNSIFLFMFSDLWFSVHFSSMISLIFDFTCFRAIRTWIRWVIEW